MEGILLTFVIVAVLILVASGSKDGDGGKYTSTCMGCQKKFKTKDEYNQYICPNCIKL